LKLSINHSYKKCAPKQLFFNAKKIKDSDDFLHRKFTLKNQNWHFFTNCHWMET
jgi:hypothetical protein